MRRTLAIFVATCALAAAQTVLAGTYYPLNTTSLAPQSTEPVILGEVTSQSNDAVMVRTPDGQVLPIHFDSHTLMNRDMANGTPVRVSYKLSNDNVYLAQRITPLEHGSADWNQMVAMMDQHAKDYDEQYASNDMDRDHDMDNDHDRDDYDHDRNATSMENDRYSGRSNDESDLSGRSSDNDDPANQSSMIDDHDRSATEETTTNDHDADDRQLPQTATSLTLVLMTGWLLVTAAGCLWLVRRRSV